jgi:NhaP-type Na+/H+ or K+/H+ antiporter
MDQLIIYIGLLSVIVITGQVFYKSTLPLSLLLVIVGMILSIIPGMPRINLNSEVVLNIFLPVMIYQISSFSSWKDVKNNLKPIISLSFGHVIFITILVAVTMHALIPDLGWALAFVLGSVISPPDDVAIVSIADKIRMPARIKTIL